MWPRRGQSLAAGTGAAEDLPSGRGAQSKSALSQKDGLPPLCAPPWASVHRRFSRWPCRLLTPGGLSWLAFVKEPSGKFVSLFSSDICERFQNMQRNMK